MPPYQKLPAAESSRFSSKPLNVFFRDKKKNAGAVLPVSITGTYPHAKAQVSLTGKR